MKYFDWTKNINEEELKEVVNCLENDGLVIFPTETVYGIAAKATSLNAVNKVYETKSRPRDKAINIMVSDKEKIKKYVIIRNETEEKIIDKLMPGPITLILDKLADFGEGFTKDNNTIGVRIPKNEIALKILSQIDFPIIAPSANISDKPPAIEVKDIIEDFKDKVDIIIDGGKSKLAKPSTIIRVDKKINILREGIIKKEDIRKELE